jgi:hypothetical protein
VKTDLPIKNVVSASLNGGTDAPTEAYLKAIGGDALICDFGMKHWFFSLSLASEQ